MSGWGGVLTIPVQVTKGSECLSGLPFQSSDGAEPLKPPSKVETAIKVGAGVWGTSLADTTHGADPSPFPAAGLRPPPL